MSDTQKSKTSSSQFDKAEILLSALERVTSSAICPLLEALELVLSESQNSPEYGGGSDGSIDGDTWNRWGAVLQQAKRFCTELENRGQTYFWGSES